jgi:hypothetical protein
VRPLSPLSSSSQWRRFCGLIPGLFTDRQPGLETSDELTLTFASASKRAYGSCWPHLRIGRAPGVSASARQASASPGESRRLSRVSRRCRDSSDPKARPAVTRRLLLHQSTSLEACYAQVTASESRCASERPPSCSQAPQVPTVSLGRSHTAYRRSGPPASTADGHGFGRCLPIPRAPDGRWHAVAR